MVVFIRPKFVYSANRHKFVTSHFLVRLDLTGRRTMTLHDLLLDALAFLAFYGLMFLSVPLAFCFTDWLVEAF